MRIEVGWWLGALSLLLACGGSGSHGADGAGTDAGPRDARARDAPAVDAADAGADLPPPCNTVANDAPLVQGAKVAQTMPAPAGGTFAAGTYHLTSQIYYSGPGGDLVTPGTCLKVTAVVVPGATPDAVDLQEALAACAMPDMHLDLHLTTNGTAAAFSRLCPGQFPVGTFGYTAGADSFLLFDTINGIVETYTRQ